jgi:ADP-heptose:LPS heptosyltransferase
MFVAEANYNAIDLNNPDQQIWLNPVGGLGDMLMASSILKIIHDRYPKRKFNIVRRSRFSSFFENHPAVEIIGSPPADAIVVSTMFWSYSDAGKFEHGPGLNRPFQLLAKKFGLSIPVEEKFYYPNDIDHDVLFDIIPWRKQNIIISPSSDSFKKNMSPMKWAQIIDAIKNPYIQIIQVGVDRDPYIKGCVNLIGLTTPAQLIALLRKADLLISADNFVMHAAHYTNTPSIVIWGPTFDEEFGYPEHRHFRPESNCEFIYPCMGRKGHKEISEYHKHCHLPTEQHCLNSISVEKICDTAKKILNNKLTT